MLAVLPTNTLCSTDTLGLNVVVPKVLLVKFCAEFAPTNWKPPTVEPSCTLATFRVVSTVISAKAPVKALFSAVVPRLNCIWVAIFYYYPLLLSITLVLLSNSYEQKRWHLLFLSFVQQCELGQDRLEIYSSWLL